MLVLSRRPTEKVVFPNLGISVQVIRLGGNVVRLGIDAPAEIPVLREELADPNSGPQELAFLSAERRAALRNRLDRAAVGLHTLHRRLETGETGDAEPVIFGIFNELRALNAEVAPPSESRSEAARDRGRRALVVEDNANESELLAAYLRLSGYAVDVVDDGLAAMSYLKRNDRPDAVLLDMCMPRLDGPQTINSIRCQPDLQSLKLFAVSGADRRELGVDVGPCGVDRWFSKPVNASQLVREINRELDNATMLAS
jgi:carbon storage regulator CsrA